MSQLVEIIKKWANENYERSYGASVLVECYSDKELGEVFGSLQEAINFAEVQDDARADTFPDDEQPADEVVKEAAADSKLNRGPQYDPDYDGEPVEYLPVPADIGPGCYERACNYYALHGVDEDGNR